MIALCQVLFIVALITPTVQSTAIGRERTYQVAGHELLKGHASGKPKLHPKTTEDPVHDECPDIMTHPLEYPSIAHFLSSATKPNASDAMCTLITQCSVDRLDNLYQQALAWNGPISAAIYVYTTSDAEIVSQTAAVASLITKLDKNDHFQGSLTVSLLFGHENDTLRWKCDNPEAIGAPLYPINALRNLATAAARNLMMNATLAGLLQWASRDKVVEKCNKGELIVIPAFEAKGMDNAEVPTLQFVLEGVDSGSVFQFHKDRFPPGHAPTNYDWWAQLSRPLVGNDTSRARTYLVKYRTDYEPYVILSAKRFIAYDERFRGYGQNKVVQLKWLYSFGATFHALPGHFVVAASHERPPQANQSMSAHSVTRASMVRASMDASREMEIRRLPLVSSTNGALLTAAGLGRSFQRHRTT